MQADFPEQGVFREPCVHLGNQFDRCADALAVGLAGIEFLWSEVVIDMPRAGAAGFGDAAEHGRAAVAQTNSRQPTFGH